LCATDSSYLAQLSPASADSLRVQGGPMCDVELDSFEDEPFFTEAVALRHWDDLAKIEKLEVPGLDSYRNAMAAMLKT